MNVYCFDVHKWSQFLSWENISNAQNSSILKKNQGTKA